MSGSFGREATPVPISNTVVKLSSADGSRGLTSARVGRRQAVFMHILLYCMVEYDSTTRPSNAQLKKMGIQKNSIFFYIAGWSSLAARWAHNPKVASSNLAPATK